MRAAVVRSRGGGHGKGGASNVCVLDGFDPVLVVDDTRALMLRTVRIAAGCPNVHTACDCFLRFGLREYARGKRIRRYDVSHLETKCTVARRMVVVSHTPCPPWVVLCVH